MAASRDEREMQRMKGSESKSIAVYFPGVWNTQNTAQGKLNAPPDPFIWGNNLYLTVCWRKMLTLPVEIVLENAFMSRGERVCLMRPEKVQEFRLKTSVRSTSCGFVSIDL